MSEKLDKIDPRVGTEEVRCVVCGDVFEQITWTHLETHDMNFEDYFEYMKKHNYMPITKCDRIIKEVADASRVSKDEVLEDLRKVNKQTEGHLSGADYNKQGKYNYMLAINKFGSWSEACEKAGIEGSENIKDETIIQDIKRVNEECENGFTVAKYQEIGEYSGTLVRNRFGSWQKAINKADVKRKKGTVANPIKEKEVIEDLIDASKKSEGMLTKDDYIKYGDYSPRTVQLLLGGWTEGKKRAGLETVDIDRQDVLDDIRKVYNKYGKINQSIYKKEGDFGYSTIVREFKDWSDALIRAGILPNRIDDYSKEDVLITIRYASERTNGNLTRNDYRKNSPITFGNSVIRDLFGSWNKAKKEAGVISSVESDRWYSNDELLDCLRKADNRIEGDLSTSDFDEMDDMPSASLIFKRFDSWSKAKEKAEVTVN